MKMNLFILWIILMAFTGCKQQAHYDSIIHNAMVYDGNGGEPYSADLAILGDTIAFIGNLQNAVANHLIDAHGRALAPGFINMLSWAPVDLIQDGRSQSDIRQGVTLEVFGEG